MFDKDERESLYNGITAILTDYNQRRFKKSEIKLIEEIATKKEVEEISQIISDHMTKEKLSNGILIC